MTLIKHTNNNFFNQVKTSLKTWYIKTPERALEQAYQAALKIKSIEQEHFGGQKVTSESKIYTPNILDCFLRDIAKNLRIINVRVAEFKLSRGLFKNSQNEFWYDKLKFIDEVIKTYKNDEDDLIVEQPSKTVTLPTNKKPMAKGKFTPQDFIEVKAQENVTTKKGVLPRSIGRTIEKITTEFDDKSEERLMQSYRKSRINTKTAVYFFFMLIIIPIIAQKLSRDFLFSPIVEHIRTAETTPVFLNAEMKEEAIRELQFFEEELKFETLLHHQAPAIEPEEMESKIEEKANEIAEEFRHKSNLAISNIFADLVALFAFALVIVFNQRGLNAFKALLNSIIYDLSDSAKAFILILLTDIFVGFHSPHGWEVILEGLASHLGIPANRSLIFMFIATFPVILDTVFKYWIFRYLNQISPSAVATLKNMNE